MKIVLRSEKIARQDIVDQAIFELLRELNPTNKEIEWDIDFIGEIRDIIQHRFEEMGICDEKTFYPNIE